MELDPADVEAYLTHLFSADVHVLALEPLTDSAVTVPKEDDGQAQPLKTYGYGRPILVTYRIAGDTRRAVLRTAAPNPFGHERRADRAASLLLSYDTFNDLPRHVRALDVGVLRSGSRPVSLRDGGEFFLLTDYAAGELYARDLERLRDTGVLTDVDVRRARRLAEYLAEIHAVKNDDPVLYRRRIRDLIGAGDGIMGLTDSYPPDFPLVDADWLERIEQACVSWRWRLNRKTHRLAQVHGDFHPFNVLFREDVDFRLLDRSRGAWGEPGDDVSCMAINYLFFSLLRSETLAPPFQQLWDVFWNTYLDRTGDGEVLTVVAPFFAWRGLVVASPMWYNIPDAVRMHLFRFIENVLQEAEFEPTRIREYLA